MIDRAGRRSRLDCPTLPPPLHLVAGVLDWDALSWSGSPVGAADGGRRFAWRGERWTGAARAHRRVARRNRRELADSKRADRHGCARCSGSPLALAALNQPPSHAAAPSFARVLGEMFGGDARAAAIALPTKPLHAMYAEPARAYIEGHGGIVRTGAPATVRIEGGKLAVSPGGRPIAGTTRAVIPPCRGSRSTISSRATCPRSAHSSTRAATRWPRPRGDRQPVVRSPAVRRAVHGSAGADDAVGVRQTTGLWRRRVLPVVGVERGGALLQRSNAELIALAVRGAARGDARVRPASSSGRRSFGSRERRSRSRPGQPQRPATETPVARPLSCRRLDCHGTARYH